MSEWKRVKLGDCLEFLNGKSIKVQSCGVWPVYGSNGIIGYSEQYLYENAIVLGRVGAYCGSVARESGKFWASDNTIVVKSKDSVDIDFCYYQMKIMRLNNYAGGAAQPLITHSILNGLSLSLPSLATQRRIASVLSNYDSAIANCRRQIALLEEAAMRLYKEWFKDGKGEKRKLVDVFSFERGCTITKTQVKRSRDDENRYTVYGAGKDVFGYYSKCNVCHRCVVVAAIGAGAGEVRRTLNEQSFVTSNSYIVTEKLRPMFSFMYQLLKSINFKGLNTGAAQPQISYNSISALDFMMPDSASIQRYCQIADKFVALEDQCYETIEKLTEARDRLLPKLMKGEIAV